MADPTDRARSLFLNVGIGVAGCLVLVLLYALVSRSFSPAPRIADLAQDEAVEVVLQIEVLNACGVGGIAETATKYLRRRGLDVVNSGNHDTFDLELTEIVDRRGDLEAAYQVADLVGVPRERVRQEIDTELFLDVSVLLGRDHTLLKPFDSP